jgi:phage terminase small subunit
MGNKNSGRRPQPTALKVLRGNPGQRPINDAEPKPPAGDVAKPASLSVAAAVVWDEEAPIAIAMGTLTKADRRAFGTMCELVSIFESNAAKAEPSSSTAVNTANSLKAYFDFFGLTPVGRSRIKVPKADEPVNKWAAMGCG